eukprot:TRINITY_DN16103_c0_g1_i1.p1 TRINITY_DN16103_c0_g1~~TRINITY_DN16103_c0_g1_i1.p1  ORF type:complete len:933 (+),score=176.17 TRINITY_DN16103_c0_g1_i1:33-2831(+)
MSHNGILVSARCDAGSNYSISGKDVVPAHNESEPCVCHNVWSTEEEARAKEFDEAWLPVLQTCLEGGYPKKGFCAITTQGANPEADAPTVQRLTEESVSYLFNSGILMIEAQFLGVYNDICTDIINNHSYRNHPTKVKVTVSDKYGSQFEGASKHIIRSSAEYSKLSNIVATCLPSNEVIRKRTHTITSLSLFDSDLSGAGPTARLFVIQCASYLHGSTAGRDKDNEKRHRSQLKTLSKCLTGIASGKNFRTLNFKQSKVTRVLQHPLHHLSRSKGYNVSLIQILSQDPEHLNDVTSQIATISTLTWKHTNLDNISQCKDMLKILEGKIASNTIKNQDSAASLETAESTCQLKEEEIEKLKERITKNDERLTQKRKQAEAQYRKERTEREEKYSAIMQQGISASRKELQTAKDMVTGADGAVEESIRQLRKRHEEERSEYAMKLNLAITAEREATDALVFEISSKERRIDRLLEWETRVQNEIKLLQEEHQILTDLSNSTEKGESRTEGLTQKEIESKQEQFMLLDELFDLDQSHRRYREEIRSLKLETGVEVPTDSESDSGNETMSPRQQLSDDEYDTTPPPSSSASVTTSSSSSVISSLSSLQSSTSSSKSRQKSNLKSKMKKTAISLERRQFQFTIKREDNLKTLVENIMKFVESGANIVLIQEQSPYMIKYFGYFDHDRNRILFCKNVSEKHNVVMATALSDIKDITLGQHHPVFSTVRTAFGIRYSANEEPPACTSSSCKELLEKPHTLPGYYYRSICLGLKGGRSLCFIPDSKDFEAWIVALHNRVRKFPIYNIPLYIDRHDSVSRLNEIERRFCSENHITPRHYLNSKYDIINSRRILITLLDVRTASTLDLVHAQKLFQHLSDGGHIKQAVLWAVGNPDDKEKPSKEANGGLNQAVAAIAPAAALAAPSLKPSVSDLQRLAKGT